MKRACKNSCTQENDYKRVPYDTNKTNNHNHMKKAVLIVLNFLFVTQLWSQTDYIKQWPSFRGPFAKGYMIDAKTVTNWNVETGENILWQTAIPGLGHSCPIIWKDKMFVTTAISGSGTDELKVGLYGDYLYNLRGNGSLSVFKATTGELMYKQSFGSVGGFTASGVAANNMAYFSSERGDVFVVKTGPEYKLVSQNKMGDILMATPAISEDVLYFRAQKSVIAVGRR